MSDITMPRGLGIVAALAFSGTALYLVFGYKKKSFPNIRIGKGSLRLESHPTQSLRKGPSMPSELSESKEIGVLEIHAQHLPCVRRIKRQEPLLMPAPLPSQGQEDVREKLVQCEADAALVESLHTTLASYKVGDAPVTSPETPDVLDNGTAVCEERLEMEGSPSRDFLVPPSSSFSIEDDCSSPALSVAAPPRYALVGCFVSTGSGSNGKPPGKPKKKVRFSPSVAEPSSNNHDYRERCKAQIAQRVASAQQRTHVQSCEATIRSIAYERPRLYSQAAKQTITYNIHRGGGAYRYSGGRTHHLGHF